MGSTLPPEDRKTLNDYAECYLLQRAKILEIAGENNPQLSFTICTALLLCCEFDSFFCFNCLCFIDFLIKRYSFSLFLRPLLLLLLRRSLLLFPRGSFFFDLRLHMLPPLSSMVRAKSEIQGKGLYAKAEEVPFLSPPVHSRPAPQRPTDNLWPARMSPTEETAVQ